MVLGSEVGCNQNSPSFQKERVRADPRATPLGTLTRSLQDPQPAPPTVPSLVPHCEQWSLWARQAEATAAQRGAQDPLLVFTSEHVLRVYCTPGPVLVPRDTVMPAWEVCR